MTPPSRSGKRKSADKSASGQNPKKPSRSVSVTSQKTPESNPPEESPKMHTPNGESGSSDMSAVFGSIRKRIGLSGSSAGSNDGAGNSSAAAAVLPVQQEDVVYEKIVCVT